MRARAESAHDLAVMHDDGALMEVEMDTVEHDELLVTASKRADARERRGGRRRGRPTRRGIPAGLRGCGCAELRSVTLGPEPDQVRRGSPCEDPRRITLRRGSLAGTGRRARRTERSAWAFRARPRTRDHGRRAALPRRCRRASAALMIEGSW